MEEQEKARNKELSRERAGSSGGRGAPLIRGRMATGNLSKASADSEEEGGQEESRLLGGQRVTGSEGEAMPPVGSRRENGREEYQPLRGWRETDSEGKAVSRANCREEGDRECRPAEGRRWVGGRRDGPPAGCRWAGEDDEVLPLVTREPGDAEVSQPPVCPRKTRSRGGPWLPAGDGTGTTTGEEGTWRERRVGMEAGAWR